MGDLELWLLITILMLFGAYGVALLVRRVDRQRPARWDAVAIRKRNIARNGYKSRMGAR